MKTNYQWQIRRFDAINRDAIDTRPSPISACTGDCTQGRACNCAPKPAECCTELGVNGENLESADMEVSIYLCKLLFCLFAASALIWASM